jgi:hypothetical protein
MHDEQEGATLVKDLGRVVAGVVRSSDDNEAAECELQMPNDRSESWDGLRWSPLASRNDAGDMGSCETPVTGAGEHITASVLLHLAVPAEKLLASMDSPEFDMMQLQEETQVGCDPSPS